MAGARRVRFFEAVRDRIEKGWVARLSPRALRVDLVLLDHVNWERGVAYPSYDTQGRKAGPSRAAVREAHRELAFYQLWEIGRITLVEGGKVRRLNAYRLLPVPDVPTARYVPSPRWSRKGRLPVLRGDAADGSAPYTADSDSRSPRAAHNRSPRAAHNRQSSALGRNPVVLNPDYEPRSADEGFHSPQQDQSPDGQPDLLRQEVESRKAWRLIAEGGDRGAVIRTLAGRLGCSVETAEQLVARVVKPAAPAPPADTATAHGPSAG